MGRGKNWTKEEKQYLADSWGSVSLKTIAKNLGRSEDAIINMKVRMGIGRFLNNGEYVSYCQLLQALYGLDNAQSAYRIPKRGGGIPVKKNAYTTIPSKSYTWKISGNGPKKTSTCWIFPSWKRISLAQSLTG